MPYGSTTRPTAPAPTSANDDALDTTLRTAPRSDRSAAHRTSMRGPNVAAKVVGADVELAVAEAVDPQHLGDHAAVLGLAGSGTTPGSSRSASTVVTELGEIDAVAQVRGPGREDVAAGEGGARRGEVELGVGEPHGALGTAGHGDRRGEQAVVGADQHALAAGHLDGHARRAGPHAGVDDGEHDARRHVPDAAGEGERAGAHVVRRDVVGEVDDPCVRREVADDGLHDADGLVGGAEVAEERDRVEAAAHGTQPTGRNGGAGTAPGTGPERDKGRCQPPDGTSPLGAAPGRDIRRTRPPAVLRHAIGHAGR